MEKELNIHEALVKALATIEQPKFNCSVKYGGTNFKYADLTAIMSVVRKPLLENGFIIMHDFYERYDKHFIKTYFKYKTGETVGNVIFPIDVTRKEMKDIGSQITYLKRYSICILCGLSAEEDNDAKGIEGNKLNTESKISLQQENEMKELCETIPEDLKKELWSVIRNEFNVKALEDIKANKIEAVKTTIRLFKTKHGV